MPELDKPTRRTFMATGAAAIALTAAGTTTARSAPLPLTPACIDDDDTPSNIEGSYFKRNSPATHEPAHAPASPGSCSASAGSSTR